MNIDEARRLAVLSKQLTETLMSAALCAEKVSAIICAGSPQPDDAIVSAAGASAAMTAGLGHDRPWMDEATLSVIWQGRSLHLGHTQGYWLLARLTRRPNQYVTHDDLLREVWDDELAETTALRAGMKRLRCKLREGGMPDLARAITTQPGRYMLDLNLAARHTDVAPVSHPTSQV